MKKLLLNPFLIIYILILIIDVVQRTSNQTSYKASLGFVISIIEIFFDFAIAIAVRDYLGYGKLDLRAGFRLGLASSLKAIIYPLILLIIMTTGFYIMLFISPFIDRYTHSLFLTNMLGSVFGLNSSVIIATIITISFIWVFYAVNFAFYSGTSEKNSTRSWLFLVKNPMKVFPLLVLHGCTTVIHLTWMKQQNLVIHIICFIIEMLISSLFIRIMLFNIFSKTDEALSLKNIKLNSAEF